jgi:hypothetical protein
MVGGEDRQHTAWIALAQVDARQADSRRRVASAWLAKDLIGWNIRQLRCGEFRVGIPGHHKDVARRHERSQAVNGGLNHRSPGTGDVGKLLGMALAAARPQACSRTARQDYCIHDGCLWTLIDRSIDIYSPISQSLVEMRDWRFRDCPVHSGANNSAVCHTERSEVSRSATQDASLRSA